jgi:hypothetical protein
VITKNHVLKIDPELMELRYTLSKKGERLLVRRMFVPFIHRSSWTDKDCKENREKTGGPGPMFVNGTKEAIDKILGWFFGPVTVKNLVGNLSPAMGRGIDSRNRVWN